MAWATKLLADDRFRASSRLVAMLLDYVSHKCPGQYTEGEVYQIAYDCLNAAAKKAGDEDSLAKSVLAKLEPHFHIHEQVSGRHFSGKAMRIDAIVVPKDAAAWAKSSSPPRLGIEFKNFRKFSPAFDTKDYTKWWAQCVDYANTEFDGFGFVYVFTYNGFEHYRQATSDGWHAQAVRIFGQLGVGELVPGVDGYPLRPSLMFMLKGSSIWSEARGVTGGRQWSMERRFGSR